jgi:hypothetical protein
MSEFSVIENDDWEVWIQLEPGDPTCQGESFIIGTGDTKVAALTAAIASLDEDMTRLLGLRDAAKAEPVASV